jgi:hypothetical protein
MATTKKFRVKHGLDAGNNTISFVNDPVSANDAATKNYVDIQVSLAPGDVSNSYLTSTFTTNTDFQSYVANTNSRIDTLQAGGTLVTNAYLTSTFTTNTAFQSALANTNAYITTVEGDLNTQEAKQASDLANTNAYIATKTDDTTVLATNTALRTLIDDRIQVANATLLIDDRMQVANVISYVDTEIAALVNTAPTTLDTLNELAAALGDDANFSTTITTNLGQKLGATATVTLTGDVTGSGSFSSNAVSIALTDTNLGNTNARIDLVNTNLTGTNTAIRTLVNSNLANTNAFIATKTDDTVALATNTALRTLIDDRVQVANLNTTLADYWPSANVITYTAKYLEVANSSTGTSVTVSNSAPTITANGELWWDNASGELYVSYSSNWVEAVAQDVTPYANNGTFSSSNNTITFVRTDGSQFDVVLTGVGEVTNAYVTSTFTTNTVFQSALANTNAYIATKTDDTTVLATNTALRTLISDRMQVANVTSTYVTNTVFQSALANTNAYIATKTDDTVVLATNTALRTLIDDRMQVANVNVLVNDRLQVANADAKYATWSSLTSTNTAIRSYVDTEVAALVNSAPVTLDTLNELAAALGDDPNFATTLTTNLGQKLGATATVTLTGDVTGSGSFSSNAVSIALTDTNLGNTNAYIATKTDDSTVLATNTALRTLISDRIQVANVTGTYVTNTAFQSYVANTNARFSGLGTGDVSNSYLTSTFTPNTAFQSALANTNAYIATKTDDTVALATNTALRTLISDRMQVANVTSAYVTNTVFQSALANTNAYIATKTDDTTVLATNTALRTLIDDRVQVANLNTTLADYWPSANVITYTAKYLEVANSSTGTSVTVSNSAPAITANGELWWDNASGELYVAYNSSWVEAVAQDVTPYANNATFSSSNNTITFTRTDASQFDVVLTGVGEVTNAYVTSTFTTNTVFQSALANTNAYIATKTDDTVALATNTALRTLIDDRMQVANVEAYLANTNSYIATESARIDLVNTNLTGTNTALRTLISDRIQVANADTRFLRKDGTALQSVGGQVTFSDNVIISGNLTVSGTRTEVNTTQMNVSNTYILLNSDLGSGTAATENAGLIVNRGSEANVYFRWNETNEYWEYGEADGTFVQIGQASATTINARNESGSTIDAGTPVYVTGYSGGGSRPLVAPADADDPAKMPALGLALETATTGNNIRIASYGVYENANTGVFTEGQELYVDTTAGKLTASRPSGNSTKIQKIGQVLRSHASAGTILIQGAGRSNDIPNLSNLNVFIGNTSGVGTTRQLQYSDLSDVGYVTANTISIKNPANYHEYTVTVDTKTSAHPYSGGSSSAYFLDSVESPSIVLAPNQTYRFDQSDSTNSSHPLDFYVDADKNTAYTTGVTVSGTAGSAGAYTEIVVDEDTPQVLYYQCQNHSYMGSVASILSDTSPKYLQVANSTSFITSSALTPYLQVANVATELADYWPSANIIAYTAKYLEVANNVGSSAANTSTTSATLSGNTATFTRADSSTFTLDLSSFSTAVASPYEVNIDTFTANGTATSFGHTADVVAAKDMIVTVDGVIQRPTTDYTVSSNTVTFGSPPANTSVVAVRVTTGAQAGISNTTFQSALANTNAYIATKLDSANSFSAITVSGGNTLLTTTTGTELNIVAGNNMIIDANDATKTLTISSSASGGGSGFSAGSAATSGSPNSLTFDLSTGTDFTATISPNSNAGNTNILFTNIPAFGSFNFTFKGESIVTGGYDVTNFDTMVGQPHSGGTDEIDPVPALPYGIEINPTATRIVVMNRGAGLLEYVANSSPTYGNYFEGGMNGSTVVADTQYGDPGDEGDIRWTDSGSSLILVTKDGILKRFKCSTAYDLSTYDSGDIDSYDLTTNSNVTFTNILGLEVSPDGTKFFFADNDLNNIYEFTASTAYDITSLGSTPTNTFTPTSGDLYGISFNDDGTALYQSKSSEYLDTHFLGTAYDLSSHSSTTTNSLSFDAISAGGTHDVSDHWPSSIRWALDGQLAVHTTDGDDTVFFMWIPDSSITSTNPNAVFSSDIIGKKPVGPSKNNYISFTLNASAITGSNKLFYNGSASSAEALGLSLIYGD